MIALLVHAGAIMELECFTNDETMKQNMSKTAMVFRRCYQYGK
jgi:hypothetical protein